MCIYLIISFLNVVVFYIPLIRAPVLMASLISFFPVTDVSVVMTVVVDLVATEFGMFSVFDVVE